MVKTFNQNLLKKELADLFKLIEIKLINERLMVFNENDEILANKIELQITNPDLIHDQIIKQTSDLISYVKTDIELFNRILINFYFSHSDNKPAVEELAYYISNIVLFSSAND